MFEQKTYRSEDVTALTVTVLRSISSVGGEGRRRGAANYTLLHFIDVFKGK